MAPDVHEQAPRRRVALSISAGGGTAANVIPSRVLAHLEVRSPTLEQLLDVQRRVRSCLESGALATGASLTIRPHGRPFADLHQDPAMSAQYGDALHRLGRQVSDATGEVYGSTDMGNVSHVIPSIHPTIGYDVGGASFHTAEFAAHGCSASADRAVVDAAIALAWTGVGIALDRNRSGVLTAG